MANQVTACNFLIPAYRIDCATGTPAISSRLDEYLATFCHIVEGVDSAAGNRNERRADDEHGAVPVSEPL